MPWESVGEFILYATAEEKKKMSDIFKSITPYQGTAPTLTGVVFSTSSEASKTLPQQRLLTRL
jgi:hypothetical protein